LAVNHCVLPLPLSALSPPRLALALLPLPRPPPPPLLLLLLLRVMLLLLLWIRFLANLYSSMSAAGCTLGTREAACRVVGCASSSRSCLCG
jgi:hypothetical protein